MHFAYIVDKVIKLKSSALIMTERVTLPRLRQSGQLIDTFL